MRAGFVLSLARLFFARAALTSFRAGIVGTRGQYFADLVYRRARHWYVQGDFTGAVTVPDPPARTQFVPVAEEKVAPLLR